MSKRQGIRPLRGLLAVVAVLGALVLQPRLAEARTAVPGVRVVSSTQRAVVVEYVAPPLSLLPTGADGRAYVEVRVGELPYCAHPGEPQLPCAGVLLGLPPTGGASVRVLEQETAREPLSAPVYPVPMPELAHSAHLPGDVSYRVAPDAAVYAADALFPAASVVLGEPGWVRSQRVARLAVHPVRYHPQRQELVYVRRLLVEVRFEAEAALAEADLGWTGSAVFDALLGETLINADVASHWRVDRSAMGFEVDGAREVNAPANQAGSYKILVDQDGFYRLTYADLQAAGLPVRTLDPRRFQLFEGEREIAISVSGQNDGSFDAADEVLFYGRAPRSRYTRHNVYWLRYGDRVGRRMARRQIGPAGQPAGVLWTKARWQVDRFYDPLFAAMDGDHWYAADLRSGEREQIRVGLLTPALGPEATVWVYAVGYTYSLDVNPDHHLVVRINGRSGGDLRWDGKEAVAPAFRVAAERLRAGSNDFAFELPGDTGAAIEGMWLDAVEVDYALQAVHSNEAWVWTQVGTRGHTLGGFTRQDLMLYDVTDPTRPVELRGFAVTGSGGYRLSWSDTLARTVKYYALAGSKVRRPVAIVADRPSQLHSATNRADYVLIAHGDLMEAARPLLNQRQLQGLRVAAVDVQDIYDEFGGGLVDPEAIRAFVAYAYRNWAPPALSYVVLFGDGHYDFLDHYGYGAINYIPPYLAMVDPWREEMAADNRYAAVVGNDVLPDVMLGRLPASSPAQARALVAKTVGYERKPYPGWWNTQHVFVADRADRLANYAAALDVTYGDFIRAPWQGTKIYMDRMTTAQARQEVLAAWQRGALLISYMGHSSWHQWSVGSILHVEDVPALQNGRRLPVLLSMTCYSGFFHHPEYGTLDEELVRLQGGGAVASWSPSGLGLHSGHQRLHQGFYRSVVPNATVQLGRAILAAKLDLHAYTDAYDDLLDTYHLFGDPAMVLDTTFDPRPHTIYLPMIFGN